MSVDRHYLSIIQQMDPFTTEILAFVRKVTLFIFCGQSAQWEESNVEGEFFVCSRSCEPYNTIHILNKSMKNNLMEPIVQDWDWKTEDMLLLYRKGQNIFGIRFYNDAEYGKIATLIETIMHNLKQNKATRSPRGEASPFDIINILSQAQEDFQKVAGVIQTQLYQKAIQIPATPQVSHVSLSSDSGSGSGSSTPSTIQAVSPASSVTTVIEAGGREEEKSDEKLADVTSFLSLLDNVKKPVLITPEMFEKRTKEENQFHMRRSLETPEPLNQRQLIQAIIYLLKNDADFVAKLHDAYIKSFLAALQQP